MSPQRIDYYDDPEMPKANSLVASVNVVVVNDAGDILMIHRGCHGETGGRDDLLVDRQDHLDAGDANGHVP